MSLLSLVWNFEVLSSNIVLTILISKYSHFFLSKKHLDESHPNPTCEYCCERFYSVNKLSEHKVLACQHMTVDCLLKDFGCDEPV
jgi:hypothetical protein